jgi:hypothetical protein
MMLLRIDQIVLFLISILSDLLLESHHLPLTISPMTLTTIDSALYLPNADLIRRAETTLVAFTTSTKKGMWHALDKSVMLGEIRARIHDPRQVNQGGQPFCGPVSVLFELVRRNPARYVEICQSLFEQGYLQGTTQRIQASDRLRQSTQGNLRMPQVDWMVLATLREAEVTIFAVEPNAPTIIRNLTGMTKSWELIGWVKELLGYRNVKYNHAFLFSDLPVMRETDAVLKAGGVAFALITAEGLLNDRFAAFPVPNHWISLLGGVNNDGNRVTCDLYTWSKLYNLNIGTRSFKRYFWVSVTAIS